MNTELELHDSDVKAIRFLGNDLVIDFPRTVVYPAANETLLSSGTYLQPVTLTFLAARAKGNLSASGWISDGGVSVSGAALQFVPVPASIEGIVTAELVFASGEQLKIEATGLRCSPAGTATWLQPLPQ